MKYYRLSPKHTISVHKKGDLSEHQILQCNEHYSNFIVRYYKKSGRELLTNPFENITFETGKRNIDIYRDLFAVRGFIVSTRFRDVLTNHKLPRYSLFDKIKYMSGNIFKDDLSYIHFFESCFDFVDFSRSRFALTPSEDRSYILNVVDDVHQFKIVEEVAITSLVDFEEKKARFSKEKLTLIFLDMCLPNYQDYDLITLYYFSESDIYISENLRNTLDRNRIKGCYYAFPHFKFSCW